MKPTEVILVLEFFRGYTARKYHGKGAGSSVNSALFFVEALHRAKKIPISNWLVRAYEIMHGGKHTRNVELFTLRVNDSFVRRAK